MNKVITQAILGEGDFEMIKFQASAYKYFGNHSIQIFPRRLPKILKKTPLDSLRTIFIEISPEQALG